MNPVNLIKSKQLPNTQNKITNAQILADYLTTCGVSFVFRESDGNEEEGNFTLIIDGCKRYIELVVTTEESLRKLNNYQNKFNQLSVFFIDSAMPPNAFYEQLVMFFTKTFPSLMIPDKPAFLTK